MYPSTSPVKLGGDNIHTVPSNKVHKDCRYAPFAHVNKQFQKTCNAFFVCLNVNTQLSNFHGDIYWLKF